MQRELVYANIEALMLPRNGKAAGMRSSCALHLLRKRTYEELDNQTRCSFYIQNRISLQAVAILHKCGNEGNYLGRDTYHSLSVMTPAKCLRVNLFYHSFSISEN